MNRLEQLHDAGVSIWLDTLSRELLESGEFAALIGDCAVTGATSNPTIFAKAITGSDRYDDQLRAAVAAGRAATRRSCSSRSRSTTSAGPPTCCARPTTRSGGRDGFVSFECTPDLADDTEATIEQARRALGPARPAERDDQGPRHRGRGPRDRGAHRPRRQRQRHAAVLGRALRAGDRRLPRGPRAPRRRRASPWTRSPRSRRSSSRAIDAKVDALLPGRLAAARPGGDRQRPRAYARYRERFAGRALARARATPAPARSARCGPAPAPRTPPTPTCSTSRS